MLWQVNEYRSNVAFSADYTVVNYSSLNYQTFFANQSCAGCSLTNDYLVTVNRSHSPISRCHTEALLIRTGFRHDGRFDFFCVVDVQGLPCFCQFAPDQQQRRSGLHSICAVGNALHRRRDYRSFRSCESAPAAVIISAHLREWSVQRPVAPVLNADALFFRFVSSASICLAVLSWRNATSH